jgi:hypothetical protein
MVTRQAMSIFLSCIFYHHVLTRQAFLGVLVVFLALLLRVYCKKIGKKGPK